MDSSPDPGHWSRFQGHVGHGRQLFASYSTRGLAWYREQSALKKALVVIGFIIALAAAAALAVFHVYILKLLIYLSDILRDWPYGEVLLFSLVFIVGFPPLLGFSSLSILSGMAYGMIRGWMLLALASVTGSFTSFLFFRYVLRERAERLMHANEKFRAFADILRQDSSMFILILIRLCPLPYSLSNGALAAVPELSASTYLFASILTSPKLFLHVFIGHQIKDIGQDGKSTTTKIVDVVSLVITASASALTAYIIYNKMQAMIAKYHALDGEQYGDIVFGNFEDLESGNTMELDSADYDEDNFIIDDEDEGEDQPRRSDDSGSPVKQANDNNNDRQI